MLQLLTDGTVLTAPPHAEKISQLITAPGVGTENMFLYNWLIYFFLEMWENHFCLLDHIFPPMKTTSLRQTVVAPKRSLFQHYFI